MKWNRLDRWHDTSVYKNEKGEIMPEIVTAMIAIDSYADEMKVRKNGGKQSFDL